MDLSALFNLSYGLYVAGVEYEGKKNACIINTAVQTTVEPVGMTVTIIKDNLTAELINKKGSLTISCIGLDCPMDVIRHFGFVSGREKDKFDGIDFKVDAKGNPYIENNMVAYMSLDVASVIDLGTHYLILCDVIEAENLAKGKPMTYGDYRIIKAGGSVDQPVNEVKPKSYVCSVCHYVYDGETPFEDLPDDYICPVCKKPKSVFVQE